MKLTIITGPYKVRGQWVDEDTHNKRVKKQVRGVRARDLRKRLARKAA